MGEFSPLTFRDYWYKGLYCHFSVVVFGLANWLFLQLAFASYCQCFSKLCKISLFELNDSSSCLFDVFVLISNLNDNL